MTRVLGYWGIGNSQLMLVGSLAYNTSKLEVLNTLQLTSKLEVLNTLQLTSKLEALNTLQKKPLSAFLQTRAFNCSVIIKQQNYNQSVALSKS
ncbi:MAG: hypothetical protein GX857_03425 [Bacteroidales bacterium]|nr:hypothetical protein [Bacteroidales bacterium]